MMTMPHDEYLRPSAARVHDLFAGGVEHYPPDRELGVRLLDAAPWLPAAVGINGAHRPRAVYTLAREQGIRQFLDLGCGLPSDWDRKRQQHVPAHTIEAAQVVHPDARVLYVDNDLTVFARARTELNCNARTRALFADVRDTDGLLNGPGYGHLDIGQSVGVLLHGLQEWMDDAEAAAVMATLRDRLPAHSALSLTHATTETAPHAMEQLVALYATAGIDYRPRSLEQIMDLLGPWELLAPGIVPTETWRHQDELLEAIAAVGKRRLRSLAPVDLSHSYAAIVTAPNAPADGHDPGCGAVAGQGRSPAGAQ